MTYLKKLLKRIENVGSPLCIGLDPRPERTGSLKATERHLSQVIEETSDLAAAYKPNLAYFEAMGIEGLQMLERILRKIPTKIPTVLDAKRSDIGETQKYYAKAYFEQYGVDSVTLNPFMGYDSIEPFLQYPEKGIYLLALTSNQGSADFMRQKIDGVPLYLKVTEIGERAQQEGLPTDVGYVMGLTNLGKEEVNAFPDVPMLIPGLGAQGGDLSALTEGKKRVAPNLVNVSRGVLFPDKGTSHYEAALHFKTLLSTI